MLVCSPEYSIRVDTKTIVATPLGTPNDQAWLDSQLKNTLRFVNPNNPLQGGIQENNLEHRTSLLRYIEELFAHCSQLKRWYLDHPKELQDLVDMCFHHEDGEPDFDGNGSSDMPVSAGHLDSHADAIKQQEHCKFAIYVLPRFAPEHQPQQHQLYTLFENPDSNSWCAKNANAGDRIVGNRTWTLGRLLYIPSKERNHPKTVPLVQRGINKTLPSLIASIRLAPTRGIREELLEFYIGHFLEHAHIGFSEILETPLAQLRACLRE